MHSMGSGDVQFTLLLSLFISGRDFGLDPVHLLQTLSSQVRQQKKVLGEGLDETEIGAPALKLRAEP